MPLDRAGQRFAVGRSVRVLAGRAATIGGAGLSERQGVEFRLDDRAGDGLLRVERRQPPDEVFQLAHVAGPAVALQPLHRVGIEGLPRQTLAFHQHEEVADQIRHVLGALAQRRQAQRHHVQAEEQILAKNALLDRDAQILVGRGDDAHVRLDRHAPADCGVLALLKHAQQAGLGFHRHVADLVEEERAALRLLEAPGRARERPCEGALLVAEEFGFDQVARDRRHVDGHERAGAAAAVIVQGAGDQLLAGAGLARDHHGEVGGHQAGERPVDFLHGGRAAHQRDVLVLRPRPGRGRPARTGQRAADDGGQLLQVEGLGQVLVGAPLRGADRGHEGVLRAHHDDRQFRPHPLDARQQVEDVLVGHHHVGDDEVALALGDPAPERRAIRGGAHLVPGPGQGLVQHGADGGVVVRDDDVAVGHGSRLSAPRPIHARRGRSTSAAGSGRRCGGEQDRIRRCPHGRRRSWPPMQVRGRTPAPWW